MHACAKAALTIHFDDSARYVPRVGPLRGLLKFLQYPSDRNSVKHYSHRADGCLQRLLKLIHLGNEIRRDMDFLGYEAFCSLTQVTFWCLSPRKATKKGDKAGFTEAGNKVLSRKAA